MKPKSAVIKILLLAIFGLSSSYAGSTQIDYETFVHLPINEQRQVIKMLQMFAVDSEEKVLHQLRENQKAKKTTHTNPFIEFWNWQTSIDAYAQSNTKKAAAPKKAAPKPKPPKFGEEESLSGYKVQEDWGSETSPNYFDRNDRQHLCMNGGWFSYVAPPTKTALNDQGQYVESGGFCSHPKNNFKLDKVAKASGIEDKLKVTTVDYMQLVQKDENGNYPKFIVYVPQNGKEFKKSVAEGNSKKAKDCATSTNYTICNPDLFGNAPDGSLFCVQGNSASINTSLSCAQAVASFGLPGPDGQDNSHVVNKIYDDVIKRNMGNKEKSKRFTDMLLVMYDTCMCKGTTGYMALRYSDRIFKDRTCFGLLYQSRAILSRVSGGVCSQDFEGLGYNQLANMHTWAEKANERITETLHSFTDKSGQVRDALSFDLSKKDDSQFAALREGNLKTYIESGECPLRVSPQFIISLISEDEDTARFRGSLRGTLIDKNRQIITNIESIIKDQDKDCKIDPAHPNEFVCQKVIGATYPVAATTNFPGLDPDKKISSPLEVGPKGFNPSISIKLLKVEAKERIATYEAEVLPKDLKPEQYKIEWKVVDSKAGGSVAADTYKSELAIAFMVEEPYKIYAVLKLNQDLGKKDINSNQLEVPAIGDASCTLALNDDASKPKQGIYAYTYQLQLPEGIDEAKASLSFKPNAHEVKKENKMVFFSIPAEEKKPEEDKEKKEEKEEEKKATASARPTEILAELKIEGNKRTFQCKAPVPEAPEPDPIPEPEPEKNTYQISIKTIQENGNFEIMEATVLKNGKPFKAADNVTWFVQDTGTVRSPAKSEKDGIQQIDDPEDEGESSSGVQAPSGFRAAGNGIKAQVGRLHVDQDVVAILLAEGEEYQSNVLVVEKIVKPKEAPPAMNPMLKQPPPMMPMSPSPMMIGSGVN